MSRMLKTMVVTAGLGVAPVVGGDHGRVELGFWNWGKWSEEEEELEAGSVRGLYTVLWMSPRHTAEEGEAASEREKRDTASRWPQCTVGMRTTPSRCFL
jgi:hypothetical protein